MMDLLFGPLWQSEPPQVTETMRAWLTSSGSLTARVKQHCRGRFSVSVIRHERETATEAAAAALALEPGAEVLSREVLLCDDGQARVYAASLLPVCALTGRFAPLRELGAQPLGHWIFAEPQLIRSQMRFCLLPADRLPALPGQDAVAPPRIAGRKTHFSGAAKDFLVSEFFLFDE
ncbi:chorismate lyase [Granulosicoccaceae sp. 1_MG-2023]|nr:chorismate lyase [Granulosicoccaceae sp. 1_MG-2023]